MGGVREIPARLLAKRREDAKLPCFCVWHLAVRFLSIVSTENEDTGEKGLPPSSRKGRGKGGIF